MRRALALLSLLAAAPAQATSYYVAPNGADTSPGTAAQPFRNVQRAADVVQPGDDVTVEDGTYGDPDADGYVVLLDRGGTQSAWVTFHARNRWGAILDGNQNTATHCWVMGGGASFVRVVGFELRDCADAGFHSNAGAQNVVFAQNHVHDIGRVCTDTQFGKTGFYQGSGSAYHTYDGNVIHDIGRLAPGENGCQPQTAYYQNHDHAFYLDASHVTVENNLVYDNQRGWGVQIYGSAQKDDITIINNTFAFPNPYRDGHITIGSGTSNVVIENNVFYMPRNAVMTLATCTGVTNVTVVGNLSDVGTLQTGGADCNFPQAGNLLSTDPQLVSPSTFDFHLQPTSPAIDHGSSSGPPPSHDFAGAPRPQGAGYDVGAYEHGAPLADAGADDALFPTDAAPLPRDLASPSPDAAPSASPDGGCGCSLTARAPSPSLPLLAFALLLLLRRRRRSP